MSCWARYFSGLLSFSEELFNELIMKPENNSGKEAPQ
jgi:hypothetical protein